MLTQTSLFWFDYLKTLVPSHVLTAEIADYPVVLRPYAKQLEGRSMLVRKARMVDVECVARGYLSGSGWKEYQANGNICGVKTSGRTAGRRQTAGADIHAGDEGPNRA